MRPIYWCPENFRDSLTTPTAIFLKILTEFCSDGTVPIGSPYILFLYQSHLPEILDCSFQRGLQTPNFGEGEAVEGWGWYRSKESW